MTRESLSSGFLTRLGSNQPAQSQRLVRVLKILHVASLTGI